MSAMKELGTLRKIHAAGLSIGYTGHSPVLTAIDQVWQGPGIHLILGENGSGKSTLIRTLARLQEPLKGVVNWDEENIHSIVAPRKITKMAFVESMPPRQSELTVDEALALNGRSRAEQDLWLHRFDLLSLRSKSISQLSDGLAQRVMLVRAILQETPWILMDEPTAFLDVKSRHVMWSHCSSLVEQGRHIMVSSHDFHLLEHNPHLKSVTAIRDHRLHHLDPMGSFAEWSASL